MIAQESFRMRSIRELKEFVIRENAPEPLKSLVLSEPDTVSDEEFLTLFFQWRKLLRMQGDKP